MGGTGMAARLRPILAIGLGAILGAVLRFGITLVLHQAWGEHFPWGTWVINISGCLGMGFSVVFFLNEAVRIHPDLYLMLTTGFLGSYTTFSSYELDTLMLQLQENRHLAVFYWLVSIVLGLLAFQIGERIAQACLPPDSQL